MVSFGIYLNETHYRESITVGRILIAVLLTSKYESVETGPDPRAQPFDSAKTLDELWTYRVISLYKYPTPTSVGEKLVAEPSKPPGSHTIHTRR